MAVCQVDTYVMLKADSADEPPFVIRMYLGFSVHNYEERRTSFYRTLYCFFLLSGFSHNIKWGDTSTLFISIT